MQTKYTPHNAKKWAAARKEEKNHIITATISEFQKKLFFLDFIFWASPQGFKTRLLEKISTLLQRVICSLL